MRYSFVLAVVAGLESVGLAAPASADAGAKGDVFSDPGIQASTNVSVDTEAQPNKAGGVASASIFGENGVVAVNLKLSANDVAEEIKKAGLPDQVTSQLSQVAENIEGGKVETEQELANVVGALGKAAADATVNNNATQASSVLASVKGVIQNAMGESVAADVVIGACVVAAAVGEELNVVVKITMDTIKALQEAAKKASAAPGGTAGNINEGINAVNVSSRASQSCASDICRTAIESVVELVSKGSNHDVAATFLVAIEALGNQKSVNVTVEADFAERVVPSLKELGPSANGDAAVTKIGQVIQTLELDAGAAKQVIDEASQAAEKLKALPAAKKPAASEGDKDICDDGAKLIPT